MAKKSLAEMTEEELTDELNKLRAQRAKEKGTGKAVSQQRLRHTERRKKKAKFLTAEEVDALGLED